MSYYFITTDQAEKNEIFAIMETKSQKCSCGQSYALYLDDDREGTFSNDLFIVCDACHDNYPRERYF